MHICIYSDKNMQTTRNPFEPPASLAWQGGKEEEKFACAVNNLQAVLACVCHG